MVVVYSELALLLGIAHHSEAMSTFGRSVGTEVGLHVLACAGVVDMVVCFASLSDDSRR